MIPNYDMVEKFFNDCLKKELKDAAKNKNGSKKNRKNDSGRLLPDAKRGRVSKQMVTLEVRNANKHKKR